ncbi:guanylate kinase [bacterium]|nr:guanylate kinase [bacterium]
MSIGLERRGSLFVVAAPSGGGKSTVLKALLGHMEGLRYSISVTSRSARAGEEEGRDFHFVAVEEFHEMIERKEFYEWAKVHGNYYGTRKKAVENILADGHDVAMDLDVQGACQIKGMKPDAVTIFLLPPSMETLERRLRGRETDGDEVIRLRLHNAAEEIASCALFDYLVVNDDLDRVIHIIESIVIAERQRGLRQDLKVQGEPRIEELLNEQPA